MHFSYTVQCSCIIRMRTSRFPQVPAYLNRDRGELSAEQLKSGYILYITIPTWLLMYESIPFWLYTENRGKIKYF